MVATTLRSFAGSGEAGARLGLCDAFSMRGVFTAVIIHVGLGKGDQHRWLTAWGQAVLNSRQSVYIEKKPIAIVDVQRRQHV